VTRRVDVALGSRAYPILIGPRLLRDPASFAQLSSRSCKVVTDESVAALYLGPLLEALGLSAEDALVLPPGESQKTWQTAGSVLDWLMSSRLARDGVLIALGGGVIGDLAGFCASVYQRGIDFVQVPTTLLAQVDSSVGGKTAVNHARGKNMIGAFHQPLIVIADTDTLATLPRRELQAGIAEVIKYGMLGDARFFEWLEQNASRLLALEPDAVAQVVARCCEMKAGIVALDEREALAGGPRMTLNLGHTFGHAIETETGYATWLHGEAVAVGLCMAADLSERLSWITASDAERCKALVARYGLPTVPPANMDAPRFRAHMTRDKKVSRGRMKLVLMRRLGEATVTDDFDDTKLEETLAHYSAMAHGAHRQPDAA
jgi:3-dehydroquinate synthase